MGYHFYCPSEYTKAPKCHWSPYGHVMTHSWKSSLGYALHVICSSISHFLTRVTL